MLLQRSASPLRRARQLLALDRDDITVFVIYGVALGLLSLAVPIAVQSLVNTVAFGSLLQPLVVLTALSRDRPLWRSSPSRAADSD